MTIQTCDVNDTATATESWTAGFTNTIVQLVTAVSIALLGVTTAYADTVSATDAATGIYARDVVESATATDSASTQLHGFTDAVTGGTAASTLLNNPTSDALSAVSGTDAVLIARTTSVVEQASASATPSAVRSTHLDALSTGSALSALFGFNDVLLTETVDATSAVILSTIKQLTVTEQATATDAPTIDGTAANDLVSNGTAASSLSSQATRTADLADSALATDSALYPVLREAWVMNTESTAMSRYEGLPVQSIAVIGGRYFALGDGGLYEFTGATDDGAAIQASVKTGRSTLGLPAIKRVADLIVSYVCSGTMTVKISTYGHGQDGTYTYDLPKVEAAAPRANRVKLGKGLASRYFQFEFLNKDGSSFGVDSATVDVAPSNTRRI